MLRKDILWDQIILEELPILLIMGHFVELESGVEGLVHVSEMSWTKKNVQPWKDSIY